MSEVLTWSSTAASNNSAPPDGWPEGMFSSSVNNCARENMAATARFADMLGLPFINVGFTAAVASNDLTITLKTIAAANPSSTDPVAIFFRSTTITTGQRTAVNYTATTSVVLPGGGSLGFANSETGFIYIYAVYDGTNKDIGIARQPMFDESAVYSTTTIGTGSDAVDTIYTTTGRTGAAITLLGRITIQYGTAAWTNAPSNLMVWQPGLPRPGILGTVTATTSGTSKSFTGIPSWVTRIVVSLVGVSTNGTSVLRLRLGTGGAATTTGYLGASNSFAASAGNFTAGFDGQNASAAATRHGSYMLTKESSSTNTWTCVFTTGRSDTGAGEFGGGSVPLAGALDIVVLTTANGTDEFDAGEVNIWYG